MSRFPLLPLLTLLLLICCFVGLLWGVLPKLEEYIPGSTKSPLPLEKLTIPPEPVSIFDGFWCHAHTTSRKRSGRYGGGIPDYINVKECYQFFPDGTYRYNQSQGYFRHPEYHHHGTWTYDSDRGYYVTEVNSTFTFDGYRLDRPEDEGLLPYLLSPTGVSPTSSYRPHPMDS